MGMGEELDVLKDISQRLANARISYMITGSMAMNLYARPRMTRDIDIVIHLSSDCLKILVDALEKDYYIDPDIVRQALNRPPHMFNVIHEDVIVKVDFIIKQDNIYANTAFGRRRSFDLFEQEIDVISPEDLIISKLNWARDSYSEIQLNDVRTLLSIDELDMLYIKKWICNLELYSIWKAVQS